LPRRVCGAALGGAPTTGASALVVEGDLALHAVMVNAKMQAAQRTVWMGDLMGCPRV
jgi:hypothetical protein